MKFLRAELDWMVPAIAIATAALVTSSFFALDGTRYDLLLPMPVVGLVQAAGVFVIFKIGLMLFHQVERPTRELLRWLVQPRAAILMIGFAITSVNMAAYMAIKPALGVRIAYWADPLLADIDRALFLGNDPWTYLRFLDSPFFALVYHPFWALLSAVALAVAFTAPPSSVRSALLLAQFSAWTILAPTLHVLLPAGGPIFYESLGYGPRFEGIGTDAGTAVIADFLWGHYSSATPYPSSGISAMPSMHIAMTMFIALTFFHFQRTWFPAVLAACLLIFVLSVALGWHYFVDGIAGGAGVYALYRAFLLALSRERCRRGREVGSV